MSAGDRTDHVIEAIDGALSDWEVSGDAMRWTPDPPAQEELGTVFTLPAVLRPAVNYAELYRRAQVVDPWPAPPDPNRRLFGMEVVEDPSVPVGEAVIVRDDEVRELPYLPARVNIVDVRYELHVAPGMSDQQRVSLVERFAEWVQVPPCLFEHRWTNAWSRPTGSDQPYRRYCVREDCDAWQDQRGGYEPPELRR